MEDFRGKRALITGGATGIGRALALVLAREGAEVVIASTNAERLELAVESIRAAGGSALAITCDVSDREAVRALAKAAGPVDLLCVNAGVTTAGSYLEHRDTDYDWVMGVVLGGVTNCVQAFYPLMAARGSGHILLTGSQTAFAPDWVMGHGPYVAAKAAVHALAFALRPEAAAHGVGVSLLVPAYTHTDIGQSERARPARFGAPLTGEIAVRDGAPAPLPDHPFALSPAQVAEQAIAGIRADAPLIATHAGMKPVVQDYFARVLAAYDDAARRQTGEKAEQ